MTVRELYCIAESAGLLDTEIVINNGFRKFKPVEVVALSKTQLIEQQAGSELKFMRNKTDQEKENALQQRKMYLKKDFQNYRENNIFIY